MAENIFPHEHRVPREDKEKLLGHQARVLWFTGLSGSGKTTIANATEYILNQMGIKTHILDGDNIRAGLNKNLGFSPEDRNENIRRITEVAKLFVDSGTLTLTAFISPYRAVRDASRDIIGKDFIEVYIKADLSVCESRDPKGLYKKARAGLIKNFTGIDAPYEEPLNPELVIETDKYRIDECAMQVVDYLINQGIIDKERLNYLKTNKNMEKTTWSVKNHGNTEIQPDPSKYAVFVGRFQPYHYGHINLIEQKLLKGVPCLILVRDIPPNAKNPFTTEQTVAMIKKYHASKGHKVDVRVIPDIESVNWGRGVGYEMNEFFPPENLGWISATKIRNAIKEGAEDWKEMVDESIQGDVVKYLTESPVLVNG